MGQMSESPVHSPHATSWTPASLPWTGPIRKQATAQKKWWEKTKTKLANTICNTNSLKLQNSVFLYLSRSTFIQNVLFSKFMTYKNKITPLKSSRFGDRVTFSGNLDKNDLSIIISDMQLTDKGIYNCYVRNPPDRIQGHGATEVFILTECKASVWAKKLYLCYLWRGHDKWCFLIASVVKSRIRIECCIDDLFLKLFTQQKATFPVAFWLL